MAEIPPHLSSVVGSLSDQNYEQSLALYRLWFDIGLTHCQIAPDKIFEDIRNNSRWEEVSPKDGQLFHPTAHLTLRFASDAESDSALAPHAAGLQSRLCAAILGSFFNDNIYLVRHPQGSDSKYFVSIANLIAGWANLGCLEESAIRSHILQSLTAHPKLYDHQADVLIVLFKLAGATFEAYADPSVVDRCFKLLKNHYSCNTVKGRLAQVRVANTVEGGH